EELLRARRRDIGVPEELVEQARSVAVARELLAKPFSKVSQPAGTFHGLLRDLGHAMQEVKNPRSPIAPGPDSLQKLVVLVPVSLNVRGKIKQGLAQPFPLDQKERDQESSDTAVAVEER